MKCDFKICGFSLKIILPFKLSLRFSEEVQHMGHSKNTMDKKSSIFSKKDEASLNSSTGYKDTGNDAQVHGKARAVRNNENGSHH